MYWDWRTFVPPGARYRPASAYWKESEKAHDPDRTLEAQADALLPVRRPESRLEPAMHPAVETGHPGHEMDDPADGVRAVEDRRGAPQDLDALDVLGADERRVGPRPAVAFEPGAVDEVEDPAPGQPAHGRDEREPGRAERARRRGRPAGRR